MSLLNRLFEFVKENVLNSLLLLLLCIIKRSFDKIIITTEATELRFANYQIVNSESLTVAEKQALKEEIEDSRMFLTDSFQKIVCLRDIVF